MMNKIIILFFVAAIILYPIRRHFDSINKIRHLIRKHFLPIRFVYVCFALLWYFINKNSIILSERDATNIGIPILLYILVPSIFLLIYAVYPVNRIWALSVVTLVLGWALHTKRQIHQFIVDVPVKVSETDAVIGVFILICILVCCISMLYFSGPYLKRKLAINNQNKSN